MEVRDTVTPEVPARLRPLLSECATLFDLLRGYALTPASSAVRLLKQLFKTTVSCFDSAALATSPCTNGTTDGSKLDPGSNAVLLPLWFPSSRGFEHCIQVTAHTHIVYI